MGRSQSDSYTPFTSLISTLSSNNTQEQKCLPDSIQQNDLFKCHNLQEKNSISLSRGKECHLFQSISNSSCDIDTKNSNQSNSNKPLFSKPIVISKCAFCSSICQDYFCFQCRILEEYDYSFCEFVYFRLEEMKENKDCKNYSPFPTRNRTTNEDKTILVKYYQKQAIPTRKDLEAIKQIIGWNYGRILKWFDNHRHYRGPRKKKKKEDINKKKRPLSKKDKRSLEKFFQQHKSARLSHTDVRQLVQTLSRGWNRPRIVEWMKNRRRKKKH